MIFATGGTAEGDISIRSSPAVFAAVKAASSERTPRFSPCAPITRNSSARISLLMRSRSVATGSYVKYSMKREKYTNLIRKLAGVGEDYFGFALVGGDFAGESDDGTFVTRKVAKLCGIVGEDDARESARLVVLTEVEKDGAGGGSIGAYERAAHGGVFADVVLRLGIVDSAYRNVSSLLTVKVRGRSRGRAVAFIGSEQFLQNIFIRLPELWVSANLENFIVDCRRRLGPVVAASRESRFGDQKLQMHDAVPTRMLLGDDRDAGGEQFLSDGSAVAVAALLGIHDPLHRNAAFFRRNKRISDVREGKRIDREVDMILCRVDERDEFRIVLFLI